MKRSTPRVLLLAGLLLVGACISTSRPASRSGDPNRITAEELEPYVHLSAFEAVRQLRPRWIQTRPPLEPAVVHVDGSRRGELDVLRRLQAEDIAEMVYLSAADATTRYGTGYRGGVIEVTTRS
jgi:hypothetical protein